MSINNLSLFGDNNYVSGAMTDIVNYLKMLLTYEFIKPNQSLQIKDYINKLDTLHEKWKKGLGKCLVLSDTKIFTDIGEYLANEQIMKYFNSKTISKKVIMVWDLLMQIPDNDVFEVITGEPYQGFIPNIEAFVKILTARANTALFVNEVIQRNQNKDNKFKLLDISTILLIIIIRTEAHEYSLLQLLNRAQEKSATSVNVPLILSVENAILKDKKYKSDARAIRDAVAHNHFTVTGNDQLDYTITFSNYDQKWQFYKKFSRIDLLDYYQDFDRLFILYTRLLTIRLLHSFLLSHFLI
jgi:hypothetical protein